MKPKHIHPATFFNRIGTQPLTQGRGVVAVAVIQQTSFIIGVAAGVAEGVFHPHLTTDSDQFPEGTVFVGGGFLSCDAVDEANAGKGVMQEKGSLRNV